jgi:parvulin-like peptidyl-prolyl isomerase
LCLSIAGGRRTSVAAGILAFAFMGRRISMCHRNCSGVFTATAVFALLLSACTRARPGDEKGTVEAPEHSAVARSPLAPALPLSPEPYPLAAWRLASPGALAPVVLWFSQIVVRHAEARHEVSFNLAYWSSVGQPTRSRAEAYARAQHVAEEAARAPSRFPELARSYSEDLPSRDEGGGMGGLSALQLDLWPNVLDALSALRPGETSKVVETRFGFHVFQRLRPPVSESVSGAHIVIAHEQAPWLALFARGDRVERTRDEALALANEVYRQARAEPERFAELIQRYSEHRDAIADGDIGAWSTLEPNPYPFRTKRLQQLKVGEVGAPLETHIGFEILLRTAPRPRAQYRARRIVIPVASPGSERPRPADAPARAAALQEAEAVAQRLARDPAGFDALAVDDVQWEEGRGSPELTAALAAVPLGQITPTPVDTPDGFVIARRLEPTPAEPPTFESELPAPGEPELQQFFAALPSSESVPFLRAFAGAAQQTLSMDRPTAERFHDLFAGHGLSRIDENTATEARARLLGDWLDRSRMFLGAGVYERYRMALGRAAAAGLLRPSQARGTLGL